MRSWALTRVLCAGEAVILLLPYLKVLLSLSLAPRHNPFSMKVGIPTAVRNCLHFFGLSTTLGISRLCSAGHTLLTFYILIHKNESRAAPLYIRDLLLHFFSPEITIRLQALESFFFGFGAECEIWWLEKR